jgi:hypothetical protein
MASESAAESRRYHKPVVVADRLDLLRGRTTGVVSLPPHLKWSGSPRYDLSVPGRFIDLYLDHPGFDGGRVIWRKIVARWVVVG